MVIKLPRCLTLALTGDFTFVELFADRAPIYPAEDHQKKLPSDFAALATRTGDHGPLMLQSSAYSFARPHRPKRCLMMARVDRARRDRLHSERPSLEFPPQLPQAAALGKRHIILSKH